MVESILHNPEFERDKSDYDVYTFFGEDRYLSNMWELNTPIDTEFGPALTTEHVYQMSKFANEEDRLAVFSAANGKKAKRIADRLEQSGAPLVDNWDDAKNDIMYDLVLRKFILNPDLAEKLLATGEGLIEEGNPWEDRYWGVSPVGSGIGENNLGKIIMRVRKLLGLAEAFNVDPKVILENRNTKHS